MKVCRLTDLTIEKPQRGEGLQAAEALLGVRVDEGTLSYTVCSERSGAEGDSPESKSEITEEFPVHIIMRA